MAIVMQHPIRFSSVEPFNEPSANWWSGSSGTQEGCHLGATPAQDEIVQRLREQLNDKGLDESMSATFY
jgi:galactan endo-1,6-beta-galactosidase